MVFHIPTLSHTSGKGRDCPSPPAKKPRPKGGGSGGPHLFSTPSTFRTFTPQKNRCISFFVFSPWHSSSGAWLCSFGLPKTFQQNYITSNRFSLMLHSRFLNILSVSMALAFSLSGVGNVGFFQKLFLRGEGWSGAWLCSFGLPKTLNFILRFLAMA